MEDPNLIATLIPVDTKKLAENAFGLKHNHARYLPPTCGIAEEPTISSREPTPTPQLPNSDADEHCHASAHRIQLTFGEKPKDPSRGYAFGTNPRLCDILLGYRGTPGISSVHFYITFNEQQHFVLKSCSPRGTAVSYSCQASNEVRYQFCWILDLKKAEGSWDIQVHVPHDDGLTFKIRLASHTTCKEKFLRNVDRFLAESQKPLPSLNVLGINSEQSTAPPSEHLSPKARPIYIREQKLGSGGFGGVDLVVDVSTGYAYARKCFYEPKWEKNNARRERQRAKWLEMIRKEVRIMISNPHVFTVQVVGFWETPVPILVMPYFPLGNLEDVHREHHITWAETTCIMYQALRALEYLHPRCVAHRDLKPENILVESRYPFSIKLADFGLANDKADLTTLCGTRLYAAPEIYFDSSYSTSVDLWSLGVVLLQFGYGLPETISDSDEERAYQRTRMKKWALSWCRRIMDHANYCRLNGSDGLLDLVTSGMLRIDSADRFAASECLNKGRDLGLFDDYDDDTGAVTPTQQTVTPGVISADNGSTTIIEDALWEAEADSNYDHGGNRESTQVSESLEPLNNPYQSVPVIPSPGSFGCAVKRRNGTTQVLVDFQSGSPDTRLPQIVSYKRHHSSGTDLSKHSSTKSQAKRRSVHSSRLSSGDTTASSGHSSRVKDHLDNQTTVASSHQYGLTYPSELLDGTNISGCSIPT